MMITRIKTHTLQRYDNIGAMFLENNPTCTSAVSKRLDMFIGVRTLPDVLDHVQLYVVQASDN